MTSFANHAFAADGSQPTVIDNQTAKFKLSAKLNDQYPNNNIEVAIFNNEVLLTGQVASQNIKDAVYQEARRASKLPTIANYLTVGKNETVKEKAADSLLTSKISSKLLTISGVDSGNVKVVTTGGVVYLLGVVSKSQGTAIINNVKTFKKNQQDLNIVDLMNYTA